MSISKKSIALFAVLLCAVMALSACSVKIPEISSPRLVQMDGFNLYLGQKESEIDKLMVAGVYMPYEDGGNFTDYPDHMVIVDFDAKGFTTRLRINAEGTLYNGVKIGMTRSEVEKLAPEWSFEAENGRLRTEYSKDDTQGKIFYYIEYRFDNDNNLDRVYISYAQN